MKLKRKLLKMLSEQLGRRGLEISLENENESVSVVMS